MVAAGALLAWLLTSRRPPVGRVSTELDIDANVNSPYFGMTDEEIAAAKAAGANPAVNQDMRELISISNVLIATDDQERAAARARGELFDE